LGAAVVRELLNRKSLLGAISARAICRDILPQRVIASDVAAINDGWLRLNISYRYGVYVQRK
jgi:hypothetical protein